MTDTRPSRIQRRARTRPGVRMLAIAAAAAVALTGCQAPSDDPDPGETGAAPVSVLLDWSPNPDHVALYTAQHTGAYGDAGVDVTFMTPSNTADAAREVSLGRADLAISYEPDTLIAAEQGLDLFRERRGVECRVELRQVEGDGQEVGAGRHMKHELVAAAQEFNATLHRIQAG